MRESKWYNSPSRIRYPERSSPFNLKTLDTGCLANESAIKNTRYQTTIFAVHIDALNSSLPRNYAIVNNVRLLSNLNTRLRHVDQGINILS